MNGSCLEFKDPIRDAISRIRFAPQSNNLLISSWDSVSVCVSVCGYIRILQDQFFYVQNLRLYDVESFKLRTEARTEAALLDCCFQNEYVALSAGSDCSVRRFVLNIQITQLFSLGLFLL